MEKEQRPIDLYGFTNAEVQAINAEADDKYPDVEGESTIDSTLTIGKQIGYCHGVAAERRRNTALKEENQKLREALDERHVSEAKIEGGNEGINAMVAAVSAYRESLRKKVAEWHDIAEKNKNDSIAAEEVAVATYWDGNQDAMANVLSLLDSPETTQL